MTKSVSTALSIARVLALRFVGIFLSFIGTFGVAFLFGATTATDAFFLVRRLIGSWTLMFDSFSEAIFVPDLVARGRETSLRGVLDSTVKLERRFLAVGMVCAAGLVFFPVQFVSVIAPGLEEQTQQSAATFFAILAISVPLTLSTSLISATLQSLRLFSLPVAARLLPRFLVLIALLAVPFGAGINAVVIGLLIGHILMAIVFYRARSALMKREDLDRPVTAIPTPTPFTDTRNRIIATIALSLYYLLATLSESYFASFLGVGAITALSLGQRISTIATTEVMKSILSVNYTNFSELSDPAAAKELRSSIVEAMRLAIFCVTPLTLGLAALSTPTSLALLANGNFGADDAILAGNFIVYFSIATLVNTPASIFEAVILSSRGQPLARHFVITSIAGLGVRIAICIIALPIMGITAIGLAAIAGPFVFLCFNGWRVRKMIGPILDRQFILQLGAIIFAGLAACAISTTVFATLNVSETRLWAIGGLAGSFAAIGCCYVLICGLAQVPEAKELFRKVGFNA